jgi:pilus assembly protein CpaE
VTRLILALGAPEFRQQVAQALQVSPEAIGWMQPQEKVETIAAEEPSLVAISPEINDGEAMELAKAISHRSPTTALVLVRDGTLDGLLPQYMRAGFRDVVDLSGGPEELREALESAIKWSTTLKLSRGDQPESETQGVAVCVFSSKGGSGKSFVATNLATALAARSGRPTAIFDLDVAMGDCFAYFGAEARRPLGDLIALGDKRDKESVVGAGIQLAENLWGYATPSDPAGDAMKSDETTKTIQSLQRHFDHVVLDAPADYSDAVLAAFDVASVIYIVAALDVVGVRHLSKGIETMMTLGVDPDRLRIVLNRADSKVGLSAEDVERIMNIKIDALVPSSRLVPTALNKGVPVYLDEPSSPVAAAIGAIADKILGSVARRSREDKKKFGLFSRKG